MSSRHAIIKWINNNFDPKCTKIEELGNGQVYCLILNDTYGGVSLNKVKFDATNEVHYIHNFKILQAAFLKHNIEKHINVERLIKCRFQDNLEFVQWMYDLWKQKHLIASTSPKSGVHKSTQTSPKINPYLGDQPQSTNTSVNPTSSSSVQKQSSNNIMTLNYEYEQNIAKLTLTIEELEKERDFYFDKLRKIENELLDMLQKNNENEENISDPEKDTFITSLLNILYDGQ